MQISLIKLTHQIIKEEIQKFLKEAETPKFDFFAPMKSKLGRPLIIRPRSGNIKGPNGKTDYEATMKKGYEEFGLWIIRQFPQKLPKEIVAANDPMAALDYLNKHPEGPGISPKGLRDMWQNLMPQLKDEVPALLAATKEDESQLEPDWVEKQKDKPEEESNDEDMPSEEELKKMSKKARGKYNKGEIAQKDISSEIGGDLTPTNIKLMADKGLDMMKPFQNIKNKNFEVDDEVWEDAKIDAVDQYVQLLQRAEQAWKNKEPIVLPKKSTKVYKDPKTVWDYFYYFLRKLQLISQSEFLDNSILQTKEIPALEIVMNYVREGETGVAEEIILTDLEDSVKQNKPIVLRSFQNVFADTINVRPKQGRKAGSKSSEDEDE
jgi:hypothetical protein